MTVPPAAPGLASAGPRPLEVGPQAGLAALTQPLPDPAPPRPRRSPEPTAATISHGGAELHDRETDSLDVQLTLPVDEPEPKLPEISPMTLGLATQDVRMVLREQTEQSQLLTTKLNILFVANSALLTSLSISRLLVSGNLFSLAEILGFLISFSLLMRAFLPRQVAVTPNLEDSTFLERYLALSSQDYQLQMLVNLAETYNANKQRLEDVSQGLKYAAYTIWATTAIMLINIVAVYVTKNLQAPML
ncbi:hypothetical protein [Leptolyngbya sp. BL0902]|uniref:hypothetical protein n=1 Tax=Leptolyngbya sp. BL0902 TaxID=1115757 RepID=UPI0018E8351E|nr:hypothetical protein [Leptolyngbya sp. BL0902]